MAHANPAAYQLRDAVVGMVSRYGLAVQESALASARVVPLMIAGRPEQATGAQAEADRWSRVASYRFAAIQRLTRCLRDLDR